MANYIYLHGFASSPLSAKAQYLDSCFRECQIDLEIPDLNQGDFSHLTLTRQLQQVENLFPAKKPVVLIGSSFGGLTAAVLAERYRQVERVILLAPAFGFLQHWLPQLKNQQKQEWQTSGYLSVYHYGEKRSLPLHYQFVEDARHYQTGQLLRSVPTLILHGCNDQVIPMQASCDYASMRPWVQLIELESDHGLANVMPVIWQAIREFCRISGQ